VTYLRFALKCASLFQDGDTDQALQFVMLGTQRVTAALSFVRGENSELRQKYEAERRGWDIYYDALSAVETALEDEDAFAVALRDRARERIDGCHIGESS
jgi:RNase adaptor protein for sRNA GlmZ degradation